MSDLTLDQLVDRKPIRIDKGGVSICVAKVGDEVFALNDTCSHSDASLSEGEIVDGAIECWLHGAHFDLKTGEALTPPAVSPIKSYPVKIEGQSVTIEIEER